MAVKAYLLIKTDTHRVKEVVSALKRVEEVKSADPVTSPYEVIAVLEEVHLATFHDLLTNKIQCIPHISKINSCLCLSGLA